MEVRQATLDDIPELMRMAKLFHYAGHGRRWVLFEDCIDGWVNWFVACINDNDQNLFLYVTDGELGGGLVGFINGSYGTPFFAPNIPKFAFECALWVDEEARCAGVGKALIDKLCTEAKLKGCSDVFIGVSPHFAGAKKVDKLFQRLGFRIEERQYCRRL